MKHYWAPIYGNCNDRLFLNDERSEWIRCTAIAEHEGLHRCHYDLGPQKALVMWGEEKADVSIERLVGTDPLRLIARTEDGTNG